MNPINHCRLRNDEFRCRAQPLPGAIPYKNRRPMTVAGRFDGWSLGEFLTARHPHIEPNHWKERVIEGSLEIDGRIVSQIDQTVRSGNRIVHIVPNTIEPDVNLDVRFMFEDAHMMVLHKPAPLPVHPCGRYRHNSLIYLLRHCFGDEGFRPVHRLDADTTGLLILAKTREAARELSQQFERREVKKSYLTEVEGHPKTTFFFSDASISDCPGGQGKRRLETQGKVADTFFEVIEWREQSSVVKVCPGSGRTNQIRVHLAGLGHPIVGDEAYSSTEALMSGCCELRLHAWKLEFRHPASRTWLKFEDGRPQWAKPLIKLGESSNESTSGT